MSTNKSFSTETSERYARALYEVGKESNEIEKIEADTDRDRFMSGEEAVDYGIIDEVLSSREVTKAKD